MTWREYLASQPPTIPGAHEGATLYIVEGKGAGQFRFVKDCPEGGYTLSGLWSPEPDESSIYRIVRE